MNTDTKNLKHKQEDDFEDQENMDPNHADNENQREKENISGDKKEGKRSRGLLIEKEGPAFDQGAEKNSFKRVEFDFEADSYSTSSESEELTFLLDQRRKKLEQGGDTFSYTPRSRAYMYTNTSPGMSESICPEDLDILKANLEVSEDHGEVGEDKKVEEGRSFPSLSVKCFVVVLILILAGLVLSFHFRKSGVQKSVNHIQDKVYAGVKAIAVEFHNKGQKFRHKLSEKKKAIIGRKAVKSMKKKLFKFKKAAAVLPAITNHKNPAVGVSSRTKAKDQKRKRKKTLV